MTEEQGMGANTGGSERHDLILPAQQPRHHGLVVPLRLDAGMSVLLVGGIDHDLIHAFASHGVDVLALEADADSASLGGELSVSLDGVRVVESTLSAWLAESGTLPAFDLVVYRDDADEGHTADLQGVVSAAATLLRPSGLLLVSADNPVGLSRLLGQPRPNVAQPPSELAWRLRAIGLSTQRWLVPYPDEGEATSVVDVSLLEEHGAREIVRSAVRDPVCARLHGNHPTAPMGAFHDALEAGLAGAVCDSYVVLACRSPQALADATREGRLWLMPDAGTDPAWQRPRELIEIGGRRLWHPMGNHAMQTSGPLILEPATMPVALGRSGEDLLVEALVERVGGQPFGRAEVTNWATAALATFSSSEPGRYPLDLRPRHFIVDDDGRWQYQIQDLRLRFPAPLAALLFGALARTLNDSVLTRGWLRGVDPEATLAEATRTILAGAGIDSSEALEYIWVELATDVLVRTHEHVDRLAAIERITTPLVETLAERIARLPYDRLLAAGVDAPGLSADVARLTEALKVAHATRRDSEREPDEARSEPRSDGGQDKTSRTTDLIPVLRSDEHYLAAIMQLEPWQAALDELLAREGITPHGSVRVATDSMYATFFVPPDHYAKIYLKRFAGHERHAVEARALHTLEREPELPVPRIVGEGRLGHRGRYLVMTRLPGQNVDSLRASLDEESMVRILGWSGAFLRRLRGIPLDADERDDAWEAATTQLASLRHAAVDGLRTRSSLPEPLVAEAVDWLPTEREFLGSRKLLTLTHGAFRLERVIVDIEAGAFVPTGVIDFSASMVMHPMWDFVAAWTELRSESTALVDAFMGEAAFPGFGTDEFPRRALAWAILQGADDAYALPDIDAVGSLDELAALVFGQANDRAALTGPDEEDAAKMARDAGLGKLEPEASGPGSTSKAQGRGE